MDASDSIDASLEISGGEAARLPHCQRERGELLVSPSRTRVPAQPARWHAMARVGALGGPGQLEAFASLRVCRGGCGGADGGPERRPPPAGPYVLGVSGVSESKLGAGLGKGLGI